MILRFRGVGYPCPRSRPSAIQTPPELANNPGGIRRYLTARDENRPVSEKSDQNLSTFSVMKYTSYWKSTELRYRIKYSLTSLQSSSGRRLRSWGRAPPGGRSGPLGRREGNRREAGGIRARNRKSSTAVRLGFGRTGEWPNSRGQGGAGRRLPEQIGEVFVESGGCRGGFHRGWAVGLLAAFRAETGF